MILPSLDFLEGAESLRYNSFVIYQIESQICWNSVKPVFFVSSFTNSVKSIDLDHGIMRSVKKNLQTNFNRKGVYISAMLLYVDIKLVTCT